MNKDTITTIVGIATLVATIAQIVAQVLGGLDPHTTGLTVPATLATGVAALGYKAKGV